MTLLFHVEYGCYRVQEVKLLAKHYLYMGDQFKIIDYHLSMYSNPECTGTVHLQDCQYCWKRVSTNRSVLCNVFGWMKYPMQWSMNSGSALYSFKGYVVVNVTIEIINLYREEVGFKREIMHIYEFMCALNNIVHFINDVRQFYNFHISIQGWGRLALFMFYVDILVFSWFYILIEGSWCIFVLFLLNFAVQNCFEF